MNAFFKPQSHKGTKGFAVFFFMTLCLSGSAFVLPGCSLFGVGEAEYACPEPGKGVCKSARQIYRDTDPPTLEVPAPAAPTVITKTDPLQATPETLPNRIPAQTLRIWMAPWVDKQGNWHSGGIVMTDIYPREWQLAVPVYSPPENK